MLYLLQCLVLPQTVHVRHNGVALLATFGLVDGVGDAGLFRPVIGGRAAVELADERRQTGGDFKFCEILKKTVSSLRKT